MLTTRDNFCPNCGQENHYVDYSFKTLWHDFIGSLLNFDGKIWNTLKTIIFYPGKISSDYISGKRIRYVPPFRLYLFISFIYFLLLGFLVRNIVQSDSLVKTISHINRNLGNIELKITEQQFNQLKGSSQKEILLFVDSIISNENYKGKLKKSTFDYLNNRNAFEKVEVTSKNDSIVNLGNITQEDPLIENSFSHFILLQKQLQYDTVKIYSKQITAKTLKLVYENPEIAEKIMNEKWGSHSFLKRLAIHNTVKSYGVFFFGSNTQLLDYTEQRMKTFIASISYIMFFVMPFVAFIFYLFYFKKQPYFFPHLVCSLHLHSILFLGITVYLLIFYLLTKTNASGWLFMLLTVIYSIGMPIYFITANKVFYKESWMSALTKTLVISSLYFIIIVSLGIALGFGTMLYL